MRKRKPEQNTPFDTIGPLQGELVSPETLLPDSPIALGGIHKPSPPTADVYEGEGERLRRESHQASTDIDADAGIQPFLEEES
jgi:hypothetical protein